MRSCRTVMWSLSFHKTRHVLHGCCWFIFHCLYLGDRYAKRMAADTTLATSPACWSHVAAVYSLPDVPIHHVYWRLCASTSCRTFPERQCCFLPCVSRHGILARKGIWSFRCGGWLRHRRRPAPFAFIHLDLVAFSKEQRDLLSEIKTSSPTC